MLWFYLYDIHQAWLQLDSEGKYYTQSVIFLKQKSVPTYKMCYLCILPKDLNTNSYSAGWEVGSRGRPWLQVHVGLGACQPRQATELCRWSFSYFVQRRPVINIFLTWGSERVWLNQKMLSEEMLSLFCPVFEHNRCGERGVLGHCSCCWPSQLSSLVESGCGRRGMFVINSLIDLVASAELLRIIFLFL